MSKTNSPKDVMICPFSGGVCKQCAIFRGRHFELCASHNAHLREIRAAKARAWTNRSSAKLEMPEIPKDIKINIVNVENVVENRDL